MQMIKLTDKNFMSIAGKIKKFMHHQDIVTWHNFDCGAKRHIQPDFLLNPKDPTSRTRSIYRYIDPIITIVTPKSEPIFNKNFIRMNLDSDNGGCIYIGDEVAFLGNRFILKQNFSVGDYNIIYQVWQKWDSHGGFKDIKPIPPMCIEDWD